MAEVEVVQLKRAVEWQHGCTATFVQSVPVKEAFEGKTIWDGVVHVFQINGAPQGQQSLCLVIPDRGER